MTAPKGGKRTVGAPPRPFITEIRLPGLSRLRLYDPAHKPRGLGKVRRKLAQAADEVLHGWLKLSATGAFTVRLADATSREFRFDAHQPAYLAYVSRARSGGYEPAETRFLDAMLRRASVFYDIGANWGLYSLLAATNPNFRGKVYAFELSEEMNWALARMVETLGLERVEVPGYGLSDRSGQVATTADRAAHLIRVLDESAEPNVRTAVRRVARLDDLSLAPPDLMKIDVEDHEAAVLRGGRMMLERHQPLILFECRSGGDGGEAGELLRSIGYALYGLHERPGSDAIELLPAMAFDRRGGPENIVGVPPGQEARWFG